MNIGPAEFRRRLRRWWPKRTVDELGGVMIRSGSLALACSLVAALPSETSLASSRQDEGRPREIVEYHPPSTASTFRRHSPRLYDLGFEVGYDRRARWGSGDVHRLEAQVLVDDHWNLADLGAASVVAAPNGIPRPTRVEATRIASGVQGIEATADGQVARAVRWTLRWPVVSWSSEVDEREAARATWPREWPEEDQRYLLPSPYIDSDAEIFDTFVTQVSGGRLRRVGPYLAAKDLVRHAILAFSRVEDHEVVHFDRPGIETAEDPCPNMPPEDREVARREAARAMQANAQRGQLGGLALFSTASRVAEWGQGSPPELLAACVATLRAAGIPARPVVGLHDADGRSGAPRPPRTSLCAWGEFKLQGIGWVPFDPWIMRSASLRRADVHRPWKAFGTIPDLHRRPAMFVEFPEFLIDRPNDHLGERPVFNPRPLHPVRRAMMDQFKPRLNLKGSGPTVERLVR